MSRCPNWNGAGAGNADECDEDAPFESRLPRGVVTMGPNVLELRTPAVKVSSAAEDELPRTPAVETPWAGRVGLA